MAKFAGPTRKRLAVYDAGTVQTRPPSALCWLAVRLLDDSSDDVSASVVLDRDDDLYPAGDPV